MGKIPKISVPSSVNADVIRRVENFKNRMYDAVKKHNQTRLNDIHDEAEAFLRDIPGSSIGEKVILPADAAAPTTAPAAAAVPDLIDLAAPAPNAASQDEVLTALHRAEHRLTAAKSIIQLGNSVPDAVRAWAVQHVMAAH